MAKDAIVLGAGQGGLTAAIYLRLLGFDVLVVEKSSASGGKARQEACDGYLLDPGPSILILPETYGRVFRDAGLSMSDWLSFERLNPICKVFAPFVEKPIEIPSNVEEAIETVATVSNNDATALKSLLVKLDQAAPIVESCVFESPIAHPADLLRRPFWKVARSLPVFTPFKRFVDSHFESGLVRAFFYGFPSYSGQTYEVPAPAGVLLPYYMLKRGVYYPKGGIGAIPASFERVARNLGVRFQFNAEAIGLDVVGSRIRSVRLAGGEKLTAKAFVANIDLRTIAAMMGRHSETEPSLSYFTFQWGVADRCIPLSHHNLMVPTEWASGFSQLYRLNEVPESPLVYLCHPAVSDPGVAPDGCSCLFAAIAVPTSPDADWDKRKQPVRDSVLKVAEQGGFSLDISKLKFEKHRHPGYFASVHGNVEGGLYGPSRAGRKLGLFPPSNRDRSVTNLFYCGSSVQPGSGLPMVTISGRFAAMEVEKADRDRRL